MSGFSVVVPVFNEGENVRLVCQELLESFEDESLEILFVDDGSADASLKVLDSLERDVPQVRVLKLGENHGQAAALLVGFCNCRSPFALSLDGDGQYRAADLRAGLALLRSGFAIVNGHRIGQRRTPVRSLAAMMARRITNREFKDVFCPVKGLNTELCENLWSTEHTLAFPGLSLLSLEEPIAQFPVHDQGRRSGQSKYSFGQLLFRFLNLTRLFLTGRTARPQILDHPLLREKVQS